MPDLRTPIVGAQLRNFNAKPISITGTASQVAPNNLTFQLKATDGVTVKVTLKRPYNSPLQGIIEVHGTGFGESVNCDEIIEFETNDDTEAFDEQSHTALCEILGSAGEDAWSLGDSY